MIKYKVYKGLQKEIRWLGLNKSIALQYMVSLTLNLLIVLMMGLNAFSFLYGVSSLFWLYFIFYLKDKKNRKTNAKKKNANQGKPTYIKRLPKKIEKINNGLFIKSN